MIMTCWNLDAFDDAVELTNENARFRRQDTNDIINVQYIVKGKRIKQYYHCRVASRANHMTRINNEIKFLFLFMTHLLSHDLSRQKLSHDF